MKICDIVKKSDYAVDFISTDGDTAFEEIHKTGLKRALIKFLKVKILLLIK